MSDPRRDGWGSGRHTAYSIQEVCERLSLGRSTVIRMIDAGQLKVFHPRSQGKRKPVRVTELELRRVLGY